MARDRGEAEAAPEATGLLEDVLRQRIERLRMEIEKNLIAYREMEINIILDELIHGHRSVADLPLDVRADLMPVLDERIKRVADHISRLEGAPAALPPPPSEAAAPEIVVALMAPAAAPSSGVHMNDEPRH